MHFQRNSNLVVRIKDGDIEAREEFIKGNLRLVLSVIKRFSSSNENVDDLFQIGCIGLMKAIDNFDITLNVNSSTVIVDNHEGIHYNSKGLRGSTYFERQK